MPMQEMAIAEMAAEMDKMSREIAENERLLAEKDIIINQLKAL